MPSDDSTLSSESESKMEIIYDIDDSGKYGQRIIKGDLVVVKVSGETPGIFHWVSGVDAFEKVFFIRY